MTRVLVELVLVSAPQESSWVPHRNAGEMELELKDRIPLREGLID